MSGAASVRVPSVLIPYLGPAEDPQTQDIVLYLRPQYNGVEVESTLLKIIEQQEGYRRSIKLIYLANLPGDFIVQRHIVEQHYALQLYYASHGVKAFTPLMHTLFQEWAGEEAREDNVLGSFEALRILKLSPQELFSLWVDRPHMLKVLGQSIKRIRSSQGETWYVVNYDIPALLHMNSRNTDIAVMVFRTRLGYQHFSSVIDDAERALREKGLVNKRCSAKRLFHYSKGPFEELLDAMGHLVHADGSAIALKDLSFARYLQGQHIDYDIQKGLLLHPIVLCAGKEENIFEASKHMNYHEALQEIKNISATYISNPYFQDLRAHRAVDT